MGIVAGITPTGLLLLPPELVKDNLVIQCPHISTIFSGRMGKTATRMAIATPRHPGTNKRTQCRALWTGATMEKVSTNNIRNILLKSTESTLVPPNLMS